MDWKVPQMKNAVRFDNLSDLQSSSTVKAADSLFFGITSRVLKSPVTNENTLNG
jgi:hypothetical protein